jgi:hypothetical protein
MTNNGLQNTTQKTIKLSNMNPMYNYSNYGQQQQKTHINIYNVTTILPAV